MIVRESPRRNRSSNPVDTAWPPRSPREAFLSSPGRQRKIQAERTRQSVSPSPIKRNGQPQVASDEDVDLSDEDDEETLQLKLARIEAQLKLKKLKKSKQAKENIAPSKSAAEASARVEIPVSPVKRAPIPPPESPRRVQLGIDKGLKASEVSLKRPPPNRSLHDRPSATTRRDPAPAAKSFSERLAEARDKDTSRAGNQERFKQNRSRGFGIENPLQRANTVTSSTRDTANSASAPARSASLKSKGSDTQQTRSQSKQEEASTDVDSFSGFRLSRRHLDHETLNGAFQDKEIYGLPRLLKEVVSPDYDPPNIDSDYVVFGIVASKSSPKNHVDTHRQRSNGDPDEPANQRSKFMVMRLTDLKWELDLFLFDTGFDTFWKIPEGSVIAILNPSIMPPKPHLRDSGRFSLKLGSSEDTVLEIGLAKDLGWCQSIKKDGQQCNQWINTKKTEHCDFHVNLRFEKERASRPEVNSMAGMSLFGKRGVGKKGGKFKDDGLKKEGMFHDREAHENAFLVPKKYSLGISAAQRFDADDYVRGSKGERDIKRRAQQENEKKLLKQLSTQGSGIGRDYARKRHGKDDDDESDIFLQSAAMEKDSKDVSKLGLLDKKAADIKLSFDGKNGTSKQPMGWSGAFKRGLLEPSRGHSPERKVQKLSEHPESPTKQARFMLDNKGLRLPGRESLGKTDVQPDADDDSDGLDIV